jgi:ribosomal protein S18 acetylase RimI-like enzyme
VTSNHADRSLAVREATLDDADELVRLLSLLGHAQPAGDARGRVAAFFARGERAFVAQRASPTGSHELLGALTVHVTHMLHRASPIGRITALVVDEHARGNGIGQALVRAAEELFAREKCALVEVTSNKQRTAAHAFYEKLGYTATSFRFAKQPSTTR